MNANNSVTTRKVWLARGGETVGGAIERLESLPVPRVLAGLVACEWLAVLATARVVRHAGWIYYQGGDQLWYYTLGWLLGHGQLTQTQVGYAWSALLAPIARIAGPNLVSALPAIVLLNVLVLMPAAMLALYGIGARIGGRLFGYWTVVLWIVLPFVGIWYTDAGYHQKYTELLLPQAFGLTALADFPTTVATLVSIYFCVRALWSERPLLLDGVAAGVAGGAAIAIKPASALFLAGPVLAFAYRRRFALGAAMLAGVAPAVVTLAVWKGRGLGNLPVLSHNASHLAGHGLAAGAPLAGLSFAKYYHQLDWSHLSDNVDQLREHFWSGRLIVWTVVAGLVGLARRSLTACLLVGGWFLAFGLVKGSYADANVADGSFFRILMPAFPAFVLLIAALPLLLPHVPGRLRAFRPAFTAPPARTRRRLVAVALLASTVAPLAAFAAVDTNGSLDPATVGPTFMPVPANVDVGLAATVRNRRVTLTWRREHPAGGPVFFRIWRDRKDGLTCSTSPGGRICKVVLPEIGVAQANRFVDRPGRGRWTYRVAVAANWLDDPQYGDVYLVSRPLRVGVP